MRYLVMACFALLVGCQSSGTKHDLDAISGKIRTGMTELEVTRDAGAPSHIDIDGDTRKLRYDSSTGSGSLTVTLKQNIVTDVKRE